MEKQIKIKSKVFKYGDFDHEYEYIFNSHEAVLNFISLKRDYTEYVKADEIYCGESLVKYTIKFIYLDKEYNFYLDL